MSHLTYQPGEVTLLIDGEPVAGIESLTFEESGPDPVSLEEGLRRGMEIAWAHGDYPAAVEGSMEVPLASPNGQALWALMRDAWAIETALRRRGQSPEQRRKDKRRAQRLARRKQR